MTLDRLELMALGIRLADLARGARVPYQRIWRATAGEPIRDAEQAARVSEFIEARRRSQGAAS